MRPIVRGKPHANTEFGAKLHISLVEGVLGTGKTAYGLGRISVRLENTSLCVIGVALLLWNLLKSLRSLWCAFLRFLLFSELCGVAE